ncbi:MAG: hypothetical protein ISN28_08185 [Ectothiorhodospiraceae bacterium AqS1]|nr:hypothetical protein [Ectothiorhodospiraceae bacterium AqS1]
MVSNWFSSLYDIKSTLLLAVGAMAVMICVKFFSKDDPRLPWIAIWCLCAFIATLVLALKLSVTKQELVTCAAVFVTMLLVTDKNKRIEDPLFGWVLPTAVFIGLVLFYGLF